MGTWLEEVNYCDDNGEEEEEEEIDIPATNVSYERLSELNKNLESQLRNSEEKNCKLLRDIGNLNFQLKNIKTKSLDFNQNNEEIRALKEKIVTLEDSVVRYKIKYKRTKTKLKECKGRQLSVTDSSFDNDSLSIVEDLRIEDDSSLKKMKEETLSLQGLVSHLEKEIENRNEIICQMKENTTQTERKYEEAERKVNLLNATLMEKEKLDESFQLETNSQVDEALQYVKLIENEFHLDRTDIDEDAELKSKISQFAEMIKNVYRNLVTILPPPPAPPSQHTRDDGVLEAQPVIGSESGQTMVQSGEEPAERHDVSETSEEKVEPSASDRDLVQVKQRKTATGLQRLMRTVSHDPSTAVTHQETNTEPSASQPLASLSKPKTSLSMKKDILSSLRAEESSGYPCFPAVLLQIKENQFSEENVEIQQGLFLLALKCDRMSLLERLGGQRVERNQVEAAIQEEINSMRSFVLKSKQGCLNSESLEKIVKIENYLNIINQSANRLSAASESFGALEVESKVKNSISAVIKHIGSLRFNFEKNARELTEMKNLVKQYQLREDSSQDSQEPAVKRNFSTSFITLRESVESQSISEESEVDIKLENKDQQPVTWEKFQTQTSVEKEEETFPESVMTLSRGNSVTEEINVWFNELMIYMIIAGAILLLITLAGILY